MQKFNSDPVSRANKVMGCGPKAMPSFFLLLRRNCLNSLGYLFRDVSVTDVLEQCLQSEHNGLEDQTRISFNSNERIHLLQHQIRIHQAIPLSDPPHPTFPITHTPNLSTQTLRCAQQLYPYLSRKNTRTRFLRFNCIWNINLVGSMPFFSSHFFLFHHHTLIYLLQQNKIVWKIKGIVFPIEGGEISIIFFSDEMSLCVCIYMQ